MLIRLTSEVLMLIRLTSEVLMLIRLTSDLARESRAEGIDVDLFLAAVSVT
jgi:hypothetical protein